MPSHNNPIPNSCHSIRILVKLRYKPIVIQSPLARKPTRSDVCTCRRRSDIPCQGGQYALTVVSRHWIACELKTVRKSSYKQVSISLICHGLVPQSQAITATRKSPETHLKGIKPNAMHFHTHATSTPYHYTMHACPGAWL